jgi:2-polyprenyl-3-methyl-5-hydroxy-6-metoxy-1,4-benzoquinol methylase
MNVLEYQGDELSLFAMARNWKRYWSGVVRKYVHGSVLEVGAGMGSNTLLFTDALASRWVCLEPDLKLLTQLRINVPQSASGYHECRGGTLSDLPTSERFDTIIYIDVLEHIEEDDRELQRACHHLNPGGYLVVLAPAHSWLFSEFDKSVGHYRRYTKRTLLAIAPAKLRVEKIRYLDSCGLMLSLANRLILRHGMPTIRQICFWDKVVIPLSQLTDRLLLFRVGKSILMVWKRTR